MPFHVKMFNHASTQTVKSVQNDFSVQQILQPNDQECNGRIEISSEESKKDSTRKNQVNDPISRRMDPKSEKDIKLLFFELKIWRKQKFEQIEQMRDVTVEERVQLRSDVLLKEIFLLRKIEDMRKGIRIARNQIELESKLDKIVNPRYCTLSNGEKIEVISSSRERSSDLVRMHQNYVSFDQTGELFIFIFIESCFFRIDSVF